MQSASHQPKILVISAPSGTGKSTVCARLRQQNPEVGVSISHTTRTPRGAEQDGIEYYFIDDAVFDRMVASNEFLEWASVHGKRYGSSLAEVRRFQAQGKDVLFDIDVQGGKQIKQRISDALLIFLLPPSIDILIKRLTGRGTETHKAIHKRMTTALAELEAGRAYDFHVINDDLDQAVAAINSIRRGASTRPVRQEALLERLIDETRAYLSLGQG